MDAYFAGAVEMCLYSRVAVAGWCRLAGDAFPSAGCRARGGRGVPREPADAGVSHPRCADACSSAGSRRCVCPASRTCVPICGLPCVVDCAGGAGTDGWMRISPVPLRWVRIRGLLWLGGVGLPEMRSHLPVAGRGVPREPADAGVSCQCCRKSVPIRGFLLVCVCGVSDLCAYPAVAGRGMVRGWCGNRDVWAYLIHAAQIRVRLRVPAAVPIRLLGFACLSCGC